MNHNISGKKIKNLIIGDTLEVPLNTLDVSNDVFIFQIPENLTGSILERLLQLQEEV